MSILTGIHYDMPEADYRSASAIAGVTQSTSSRQNTRALRGPHGRGIEARAEQSNAAWHDGPPSRP
jgi:hypothetical protein